MESVWRRCGVMGTDCCGSGGTLAAPSVRRTTPRHGKHQRQILQVAPAELWKLQKILSSRRGRSRRARKTQRPTRRCMASIKGRCRLSTILSSSMLRSNSQARTWRSRSLRRTCSSPTCVRLWKGLQKINSTRNVCKVN